MKKMKQIITGFISIFLLFLILLNMVGCTLNVQAENLMGGVDAKTVKGKATDDKFIGSSANFAVELFKKTITKNENSLISPISVMLALAMTANGADNTTKTQMEALLGGDIPLDTLNEYLYTYVKSLPSENKYKFKIANSIWFRDDEGSLKVEKDFLQKNADYYNAAAYKSDFDNQTIKDINNWVKHNTDGMIDKIIDKIDNNTVMYLINALVFDAEWQTVYEKNKIYDGTFTAIDGTKQSVKMMSSQEPQYINDGKATGFIKAYKNNKYSFVALLPNEDVNINDYIASLTGESFLNAIKSSKSTDVAAQMPKFSYDYTVKMNDALKALGMPAAFDQDSADFSKLGQSSKGNIYIGEVLHKTFITVDGFGTKAGAVIKIELQNKSAMGGIYVKLNRPFVYAIIDNATNLPVFIGAVMKINN